MTTTDTRERVVRYLYYEDLHFIDDRLKADPIWAAQCLIFSKYHSNRLLEADIARKYRDLDKGKIDAAPFKKLFDPVLPDGSGGKAEYITADWQANPIYVHVNNIVDTNMAKIPMNMFCKAVDEYAMEKQQKENVRILGRRQFITFLNEFNAKLGFPPLKENEDPYQYARSMQQRLESGTMKKPTQKDLPTGLVDNIKSAIEDNEDLALFNEFIYKGDVEIAIELGIKHYLQENRFPRIGERVIKDIRNFNRCAGRFYTSQTNGLPVLEYSDPTAVWTSPFVESDGGDITHWFKEWDVTFSDFMRMFGAKMTKEQLRAVFDYNKIHNTAHGIDWDRSTVGVRMNAKIRIGYHEWESQSAEVYSEGEIRGNLSFRKKPFDWQPKKNTPAKMSRTSRHYNVWYKCYYLPMKAIDSSMIQVEDFEWQSQYIFDFGKLQDQQRFGENDKYVRSSLVIWKNDDMSFAEIQERFMPKIHFLWQKYQNLITRNDVFKVYGNELLESMLTLTDDANKQGKDSKLEWMRMLEQTGQGIANFTTKSGEAVEPVKVFTVGYMRSATEVLNQIQLLYNQMTIALGISDTREGIDPKPRTSLGGIEMSMQASNNATYFIEKAYTEVYLEFARRVMKYLIEITKEDGERFKEFCHVVGQANGMLLETIKDIPMHRLGLHIDNVNTDQQMQYLRGLAQQLVQAKMLDIEVLNLLVKVDNYKYAAVLMILKYKQKQKQLAQEQQLLFNQQMALKDKDLQIKEAEYFAKGKAQAMVVEMGKMWDAKMIDQEAKLKAQTQAMLKDMLTNNRIREYAANTEIDIRANLSA